MGEGGGGGVDHGLRYSCCLREDGAEADAGEDVHVVACGSRLVWWVTTGWGNFFIEKGLNTLSWSQDFTVVLKVIEGATAGKKAFTVGVLDGVFEGAFGFG